MKALLVTSQTTFVPDNYDAVITALAAHPGIGGLLTLDNRDAGLALKALWLIGCGAWRLGFTLLANLGPASRRRRMAAYGAFRKPVWTAASINGPDALKTVRDYGFDLIVNARTREIYKHDILSAPAIGCINLHHGLLPEQRGTMCDLWALSEKQPAGFSLHVMTPGIDEGGILARCVVSDGQDRHYPRYLRRAGVQEVEETGRVLDAIAVSHRFDAAPNPAPDQRILRRNPNRAQLRRMIRNGMKL